MNRQRLIIAIHFILPVVILAIGGAVVERHVPRPPASMLQPDYTGNEQP